MSFVHDISELVVEYGRGLVGKADHWERVPLGYIARVINGFPLESRFFNAEQGKPIVRIRDIVPGHATTLFKGSVHNAPIVAAGEVVVGMDGDFNCRIWSSDPALLNHRVCKIIPKQRFVSDRKATSAGQYNVSQSALFEMCLPIPPSVERADIIDQVAQIFSKANAAFATVSDQVAASGALGKSVLKAAFAGSLVRQDPNDEPASVLLERIAAERSAASAPPKLARTRKQAA